MFSISQLRNLITVILTHQIEAHVDKLLSIFSLGFMTNDLDFPYDMKVDISILLPLLVDSYVFTQGHVAQAPPPQYLQNCRKIGQKSAMLQEKLSQYSL